MINLISYKLIFSNLEYLNLPNCESLYASQDNNFKTKQK